MDKTKNCMVKTNHRKTKVVTAFEHSSPIRHILMDQSKDRCENDARKHFEADEYHRNLLDVTSSQYYYKSFASQTRTINTELQKNSLHQSPNKIIYYPNITKREIKSNCQHTLHSIFGNLSRIILRKQSKQHESISTNKYEDVTLLSSMKTKVRTDKFASFNNEIDGNGFYCPLSPKHVHSCGENYRKRSIHRRITYSIEREFSPSEKKIVLERMQTKNDDHGHLRKLKWTHRTFLRGNIKLKPIIFKKSIFNLNTPRKIIRKHQCSSMKAEKAMHIFSNERQTYDLILNIDHYDMHHHSSLLIEEQLVRKLRVIYVKYNKQISKIDFKIFSQQLNILIDEIAELRNKTIPEHRYNEHLLEGNLGISTLQTPLLAMMHEIYSMMDMLHSILCYEQKMLDIWKKILSVRKEKGKKKPRDQAEMIFMKRGQTNLGEFEKYGLPDFIDGFTNKIRTTLQCMTPIIEQNINSIHSQGSKGLAISNDSKIRRNSSINRFFNDCICKEYVNESIRGLNQIKLLNLTRSRFVLDENHPFDAKCTKIVNANEAKKTETKSKAEYYIKLFVNGNFVKKTRLEKKTLSNLCVQFNESFRLRVVGRSLKKASIQLWRKSNYFPYKGTFVCSNAILFPKVTKKDQIKLELLPPVTSIFPSVESSRKYLTNTYYRNRKQLTHGTFIISHQWINCLKGNKDKEKLDICISFAHRHLRQNNVTDVQNQNKHKRSYYKLKTCMLDFGPPELIKLEPGREKKHHKFVGHINAVKDPTRQRALMHIRHASVIDFKASKEITSSFNFLNLEEFQKYNLMRFRRVKKLLENSHDPIAEEPTICCGLSQFILERITGSIEKTNKISPSVEDNSSQRFTKSRLKFFLQKCYHSQFLNKKIFFPSSDLYHGNMIRDVSIVMQPQCLKLDNLLKTLLPNRRRSLHPRRYMGNDISHQTGDGQLILIVEAAKNLPVRTPSRKLELNTLNHELDPLSLVTDSQYIHPRFHNKIQRQSSSVNLYVEVKFQNKKYRTKRILGQNPIWNQTIEIPIQLSKFNKISPLNGTQSQEEKITISVFDCVENIDTRSQNFYDKTNQEPSCERYLGHLSIPLHNIRAGEDISAQLKLESPTFIIGYSRAHPSNFDTYQKPQKINLSPRINGEIENRNMDKIRSKLTFYGNDDGIELEDYTATGMPDISVEATFRIAGNTPSGVNSVIRNIISKEDDALIAYAKKWLAEYKRIKVRQGKENNSNFVYERNELFVLDSNGYEWLITRCFSSQQPPPNFNSMEECAYYVSLIPYINDWIFAGIESRMCCSNQEFIDILLGCQLEHATLLANYFTYLNDNRPDSFKGDVFLLVGRELLEEGKTYYVVTKESSSCRLLFWDASKGVHYEQNSAKNSLREICFLVNSTNIYANIQCVDSLQNLSFDMGDSSCWKPFFTTKQEMVQRLTIQNQCMIYHEADDHFALKLECDLSNLIKISIRENVQGIPRFELIVSQKMRSILENLEKMKRHSEADEQATFIDDFIHDLHPSFRGKNVYGCPLHFKFTAIQDILEGVKLTGIHRSRLQDPTFGLAVRVFPYASGIFSVWVFALVVN